MSKTRLFNLAALVVGVAVMSGLIWEIGWEKVAAHLESVGVGFLAIVAVGFAGFLVDVWCWRVSFEGRVSYWRLAGASAAGSAVNAFTPLGEGGEIVKANLLVGVVPGQQAFSTVLMWNLVYRITKHVLIFAGPILLFLWEPERFGAGLLALFLAAALIASIPTILYVVALRAGGAGWIMRTLRRVPLLGKRVPEDLVEKARETDRMVGEYATRRRGTAVAMFALGMTARLLGALEVYTALHLLGADFDPIETIFLVSGQQIVRIVLSVSPVSVGVAEAGETGLFALLGLPAAIGFSQAFLRLLRQLILNVSGFVYLAWCGMRRERRAPAAGVGP